jgi:hypothetical protein
VLWPASARYPTGHHLPAAATAPWSRVVMEDPTCDPKRNIGNALNAPAENRQTCD